MARSVNCRYEGKDIKIEEAIEIRDKTPKSARQHLIFRCTECHQLVTAHRGSKYGAAHFEHKERNPDCSLSVPVR